MNAYVAASACRCPLSAAGRHSARVRKRSCVTRSRASNPAKQKTALAGTASQTISAHSEIWTGFILDRSCVTIESRNAGCSDLLIARSRSLRAQSCELSLINGSITWNCIPWLIPRTATNRCRSSVDVSGSPAFYRIAITACRISTRAPSSAASHLVQTIRPNECS